jgi:hypothetical protein
MSSLQTPGRKAGESGSPALPFADDNNGRESVDMFMVQCGSRKLHFLVSTPEKYRFSKGYATFANPSP